MIYVLLGPNGECRDKKAWCKNIKAEDCDRVAMKKEGIPVKEYCKKSCNFCNRAFLRRYPDAKFFKKEPEKLRVNDEVH